MHEPHLTKHAHHRCATRGISTEAVSMVVNFGSQTYKQGAFHYTVGWRDISYWAKQGVDLNKFNGIRVVCTHNGKVLTTYRHFHRSRTGRKHKHS